MARDPTQVTRNATDAIEALDESLDVRKGPIRTLVISYAGEVASAETDVDHLQDLQQFERIDTWTTNELLAWGRKFGVLPGVGGFSKITQFFQSFTRPSPGEVITVPSGTLVSTSDTRKLYRVLQTVTMIGDFADNYFNASTRAYEIFTTIEATAPGDDHDVPAGRINTILTPIDGIDATVNRKRSSGGKPEQSNQEFRDVIEAKLRGNSAGTTGGVAASIINMDPVNVEDVVVIASNNPLYRRLADTGTRAAFDVYLAGLQLDSATQNLTAVGGETTIALNSVPVASISSVRVNGASVAYTFNPDTSDTKKLSSRANDEVVLTTPLIAGQQLEIQYVFNNLIQRAQNVLSGRGSDLFETDMLAREGIPVECNVEVEVAIRSSFDTSAMKEAIDDSILSFFLNPNVNVATRQQLGGTFNPKQLKEFLLNNVNGITALTVTMFHRDDTGTLDVDFIELNDNEFSSVTPNTQIQ